MEEKQNKCSTMNEGYAICMNRWALDQNIKKELGLLLIISSLCAEKGYCFASNKYLSELFNIEEETISRKLKKLEKLNYINIEYKRRGCEILERNIRLTNLSIDGCPKNQSTIDEKVKENNTSNNNTSINNIENIKRYFENDSLNDLFNEFLKQRKKLKAVNSERAINGLLKKLEDYPDEVKEEMINNSIINSWKGIFPIKGNDVKKDKSKEQWDILRGLANGTIQYKNF